MARESLEQAPIFLLLLQILLVAVPSRGPLPTGAISSANGSFAMNERPAAAHDNYQRPHCRHTRQQAFYPLSFHRLFRFMLPFLVFFWRFWKAPFI
jgi:hypothetical protein